MRWSRVQSFRDAALVPLRNSARFKTTWSIPQRYQSQVVTSSPPDALAKRTTLTFQQPKSVHTIAPTSTSVATTQQSIPSQQHHYQRSSEEAQQTPPKPPKYESPAVVSTTQSQPFQQQLKTDLMASRPYQLLQQIQLREPITSKFFQKKAKVRAFDAINITKYSQVRI